jgi:ABC-2 type transport system ATP-binding protein
VFYSTHILEDVQRVSDTVAILNRGRLVAQAPIAQLLAGSGHTIYVVELKAPADAARTRVAAAPWVLDLTAANNGAGTRWEVTVSNDEAAEAELLRLVLSDEAARVTGFGRKRYALEDVFMQMVGDTSSEATHV